MKAVQIMEALRAFWLDQDGVAVIEYALLAALIAIAVMVSVGLLGIGVQAFYDDIAVKVADAMP